MNPTPRRRQILARFRASSVAILMLASLVPPGSRADDGPIKRMPADVERLVKWLPEDTETLAVARSVKLAKRKPEVALGWLDLGSILATGDLNPEDKLSEPLLGREVKLVVRGSKNFDVVSAFGSLRHEGCSIYEFAADLGDAGPKWTEGLRRAAKSIRTIAGREVFVFPEQSSKESFYKDLPWEGTFFAQLKPNFIAVATSDRYLEAVIRRSDEAPAGRALPADLPEWKHVDFEAPVWMVRHFPQGGPDQAPIGCTARFTTDDLRVSYVLRPGQQGDPAKIEKLWTMFDQDHKGPPKIKVERRPDGVIEMRTLKTPDECELGFQIYWMEMAESALYLPANRERGGPR